MAQTHQAVKLSPGDVIEYTPGSDVAAGAVVLQGLLHGIATQPIPANTLGHLQIGGIIKMPKRDGGALQQGTIVYWDVDGDPEGGVAGTGAVDIVSDTGVNKFLGSTMSYAGPGATHLQVLLMPGWSG